MRFFPVKNLKIHIVKKFEFSKKNGQLGSAAFPRTRCRWDLPGSHTSTGMPWNERWEWASGKREKRRVVGWCRGSQKECQEKRWWERATREGCPMVELAVPARMVALFPSTNVHMSRDYHMFKIWLTRVAKVEKTYPTRCFRSSHSMTTTLLALSAGQTASTVYFSAGIL